MHRFIVPPNGLSNFKVQKLQMFNNLFRMALLFIFYDSVDEFELVLYLLLHGDILFLILINEENDV